MPRRRDRERGAVAVEFALVFAIVIVPLVFGGLELAMRTFARQEAQQLSREALRYAVLHPLDTAGIEAIANGRSSGGLPSGSVVVDCLDGDGSASQAQTTKACTAASVDKDRIRVTVSVPSPLIWLPFHAPTVSASASAVIVGSPS